LKEDLENVFKKNIMQRIPSALLLAGLFIPLLISQSSLLINGVIVLIGIFLAWEWYTNANQNHFLGVGILVSVLLLIWYIPHILVLNIFLIGIFWTIILIRIKFLKPSSNSLLTFSNSWLGQLLIIGFISSAAFIFLDHNEFGINKFLLIFLMVFQTAMVDVFAYVVGSNVGKTPLVPDISPNKTVEGFLGGLLIAALLSIILCIFVSAPFRVIVILLLLLPFAFAGDLLESLIKRSSNIKDSGSLFPGHGGLWDRLDSHIAVISVAPLIFILYFNLV
jgi:phosphatidate cytidylyltransferase